MPQAREGYITYGEWLDEKKKAKEKSEAEKWADEIWYRAFNTLITSAPSHLRKVSADVIQEAMDLAYERGRSSILGLKVVWNPYLRGYVLT